MNSRKLRAAAKKSGKKPNAPAVKTPAALYETGLGHVRAERFLDAQMCAQQALAQDPGHADALHLMGMLSFQAEQYDLAVEWMSRAIRQNPKPEYISNLGISLTRLGRHEDALKAYDKAVQLKPDKAQSWTNLGRALMEVGRLTDALPCFQQALQRDPLQWDAAYASGYILLELKRFEESIKQFDLCLKLQPNHAETMLRRGLSQRGLRRFDEFLSDCMAADALAPKNIETQFNIGFALQSLGRHEEALGWFDKVLEIEPSHVEALNNRIVSLGSLHRFDDALALFDTMKALKLDDWMTGWILSHIQLLTGDFEAGWIGREARFKLTPESYPAFPMPRWRGEENIEGKTLLICSDEGMGDTIQFSRYVRLVAELGARVILLVQDPLHRVLSGIHGASQCFSLAGAKLPEIDMHCPIGSLPLIFGTRLDTIPSVTSYLPTSKEAHVKAWDDRLGPHTKLRVGLVWSGNPDHKDDHNRSLPMRAFLSLLDLDAIFISLQKDPRPEDRAELERSAIIDLTADLGDFNETAALVSCLDLVITVDTSVAHLAGALGCPTWILLPYVPDYRWLLDRDDSPWYPTVRLFRQSARRDYDEVLDRVRSELLTLCAAR